MKLNVAAFTFACGLVWGLGVFALTWWIMFFEGPSNATTFLGLVYRGCTISAMGSVVGLFWGSVDGLLGGLVFALVYNFFVRMFGSSAASGTSA